MSEKANALLDLLDQLEAAHNAKVNTVAAEQLAIARSQTEAALEAAIARATTLLAALQS